MCMIDYADGRLEFCRAKNVKGRKAYHCYECGRDIAPGEIHHSMSGKFDGTVETYRTCLHCRVAGEWLERECGGHIIGGVQEDIHEHRLEGAYDVYLTRLEVGMRRKWQRFDGRGLMPIPRMPKLTA